MTNDELATHLEYIDGVQKAQSLVLRALLRQQPTVMKQLKDYLPHLELQEIYVDLSDEQQRAMKTSLELIVGPVQLR
ncbi:hypothetical protein D3C85_1317410 [compost metagenome]